ncbi:putative TonB-dependent receptor [Flavobacterium saliperosum S13]|uniref:Outer membrane receptor proteins, mostly Fe transport n=2 Tax=Flavobacterium saliperosum TaxID=329186 RepID=A0A1G4VK98_9FLAO|nr:TonB-dependent receptor [Flavobacterium saliperosum]ESU25596.1 putative TonB-dependent receptor [Flavobacterium saliperosum S13]SCX08015.1 Outer membrane receptor proteins, mostly Fe transport [Flavobacterium saliperosum]
MKKLQSVITFLLLATTLFSFAQRGPQKAKVKVSGKVIEKSTNQPLEYASIYAQNSKNPAIVSGGMTDAKGEFTFDVPAGTYYIKVEFLGFKTVEFKDKVIDKDTNLGVVNVVQDSKQLDEVVVIAERSTVEIKLDKKVYNVGQDMMVKGGTASDVLDNVPSVSVDIDGNVSLRGNDNVRVLIDGKPSGMAGNVADALRMLPADAVEKVEVITNPSARYEAEGGGGIVNIILRKGKAQGINGSVTATVGDPQNYGLNGNINLRSEQFNLFTTSGYTNSKSPGNSMTDTEYLDRNTGATTGYINERRNNERAREGFNSNFGFEWFLDKSISWTNTLSVRKNNGTNPDNVLYYNFDENNTPTFVRNRFNDQDNKEINLEYSTNFTKKFKKDGHKLTIDGAFSGDREDDNSIISDYILGDEANTDFERTISKENQKRNLIQADYVLPIGKNSQFEAGYRGNFTNLKTDFKVQFLDDNDVWVNNSRYTNTLEYIEKVNAFYTQFGTKINKFSYLLGLRYENSKINVNQLTTDDLNTKSYGNFFPSVFLTYEFSEKSSASISYSRRINRPRGHFLNPFSNYSSNINLFKGNPDIDPAMTDAIDIGYMKRWEKLTFNTSAYINKTTDSYQFIRRESGDFVNGVPVILSTPINLATQYRTGFEFTLNYSPYRWWKLNGNFNFFRNETKGDYAYTNFAGVEVVQNFDNTAYSWFSRITSKINLPYGIDWQTNGTYNAPQKNAQGTSKGVLSANLALSKDFFKEKGTLALNVSDIFNSRKRIIETNLENVLNSYSEMQWRQRQINLSFTYRFNKKKNEKERPVKNGGDNGEEFIGG